MHRCNHSEAREEAIGGHAYMGAHPYVAYTYLTYTSCLCLLGAIGNICVLSSFAVNKKLRLAQNTFLVNLALADLVVTTIGDPLSITGMVLGKTYFDVRPALCDVIATTCLCSCVTALLSIGGISFNRYFYICHSAYYSRIFTLRNNLLLCASFWMTGIVITLPALLGWTHNVYDHKLMECHWNRTQSLTFTIFFSTCVIIVPLSVISISYIKIFLYFRATKERVVTSNGLHTRGSIKNNGSSIKLARSLFVIFSVFSVCWTPYAIMLLVDYSKDFTHEVMLFTVAFAHMHSALNPVVHGITNHHFRVAYSRLLNFICTCHIMVVPEVPPGALSQRETNTSRM